MRLIVDRLIYQRQSLLMADFSAGEFIIVNGLKIERDANFLKEVLVELLKESENV